MNEPSIPRLQVVMPMAGEGRRFLEAGYALPKPLVCVGGVPLVIHALRHLPAFARLVCVVRADHVRNHDIDAVVRESFPEARFVVVDRLTEGQACTVRMAAGALEGDAPVLVAACDNIHVYDEARYAQRMIGSGVDCLVWTYRGDKRVLSNPGQFGWVATKGRQVTRVSCKVPLSGMPMEDHAVSGYFSFRLASLMADAIDELVARNTRCNGEFYMDNVANILVERKLRVEVFEVERYIGWGTPQELIEFETRGGWPQGSGGSGDEQHQSLYDRPAGNNR
jgi:CTP:molybdopterin cytidylyltransferase MocA